MQHGEARSPRPQHPTGTTGAGPKGTAGAKATTASPPAISSPQAVATSRLTAPPPPVLPAAAAGGKGTGTKGIRAAFGAASSKVATGSVASNPLGELAEGPLSSPPDQQPQTAGHAMGGPAPHCCGCVRNVRTFLWRTLYIQAVRRHYVATAFEFFVLGLICWFTLKDGEQATPLGKDGALLNLDEMMRPYDPPGIIYGPNTTYNNMLMAAVALDITENKTVLPVEALTSADMAFSSCQQKMLSRDVSRLRLLCVALHSPGEGQGAVAANLEFTVYQPTATMGADATRFPAGEFLNRDATFVFSKASKLVYLIGKNHLQIQREALNKTELNITAEDIPGWPFGNQYKEYRGNLMLAIYVGFLIPMVRRINAIEMEFSSGLAEYQGVMGMSGMEFVVGHFITIMAHEVIEGAILLSVMYLYTPDGGQPYAQGVDFSLMTVALLLFHVNRAILIILLIWVFPKGWVGLIIGIMLTIAVPNFANIGSMNLSIPAYFLLERKYKLLSGALPNTGFAGFLRIVFMARDFEGQAGWSLVNQRLLDTDGVTIIEIWIVMVIFDFIMAFMAWYLSKVCPSSAENPESPFFFLTPSYWKSDEAGGTEEPIHLRDSDRFEVSPTNLYPIIDVKNLTKMFGDKAALDGLDLKVWEMKVTVLLGHNGAGKTTLMSILTGQKGPTRGVAKVCGLNAAKRRDDIRKIVSLCPQFDIFFEDLTCVENLVYFGSLKGCDMEELHKAVANTLKVVKLEDKATALPRTLSGGVKRRLSLAIAVVSKPKIVILDEPTTGMDPETRRNVWDVIQVVGKQHTVLLSSHDMEEADALGDYIIVMALGKAVCSGTTAFLKKACGVGYKISLVKAPTGFNLQGVLADIRKTAPEAEVEDEKQSQVIIALHTLNNTGFPAMFKTLEASKGTLGFESMGVTVASMKDVYLKINMDWAPGGKEREEAVEDKDIIGVCHLAPKTPSASRRFWALFVKRSIYLARSWGIIVVGFVLPLVLQLLIVSAMEIPTFSAEEGVKTENGTVPIELRLGTLFPGSEVFLQESPASESSRMFRLLVESENARLHVVENASVELKAMASKDFPHYMKAYPLGAVFDGNSMRGMRNPTSVASLPLVLNLLQTAQLRALTGHPTARILPTIAYLSAESIDSRLEESSSASLGAWTYWSFLPAFSIGLAVAAFATFPVAERLGGSRDVQLMTGMSSRFFLSVHLAFDWLCYMLIMIPWCLIHYAFSSYSAITAVAYTVTFACFGPDIICFCYLIAENAESVGGALSNVLLLMFVGAFGSMIAFMFIVLAGSIPATPAFMLFPPFTLVSTLVKVTQMNDNAAKCQLKSSTAGGRPPTEPMPRGTHAFGAVPEDPLRLISGTCEATSPFSFSGDGIFLNLLIMLVEGACFFALMTRILSGSCTGREGAIPSEKEEKVDEDVAGEAQLVNQLREKKDFSGHALVAWNLHKCYGPLHAVKGAHLALKPGECFGLLGVNGAGKTATFQILSGLTAITKGDAYTTTATLSGNLRQWQSKIGYCFQLGGLLDRLNAYEYLYLIGRLRGIGETELRPMVDSVISVVDLKPHANKECGVYSGGNRRKLSIAAALLGLPPIVFLDEPYAGVDIVARTKIMKAISLIKQRSGTSVMLTSHNMDECEISCDRLTIMVRGKMMCLGTVQHLRNKFGKGYRLEFMLKHQEGVDPKKFMQAVPIHFPKIKLTESHENVFSYHLEERIPWSTLFEKVAALEKDFPLEHAMVGDNTLEQIFIGFAKAQAGPGSSSHVV